MAKKGKRLFLATWFSKLFVISGNCPISLLCNGRHRGPYFVDARVSELTL